MSAPEPTRPLYWSVRRELWENRSVSMAPLAVAGVVLFTSFLAALWLPHKMRTLAALDQARQHAVLVKPFAMAPAPIMMATILVGLVYSLDAFYGERRDRSILFWKSLPVSDLTTVVSKASIPLVVLPLIAFVLSVAVVLNLLLFSSAVLVASGLSPARLWVEIGLARAPVVMLYGLAVHALWFAPVYAWLMLVSAWARRAPYVWAALPLLAAAGIERITTQTTYVVSLLRYRAMGAMTLAFDRGAEGRFEQLAELSPVRFLTAPGLWVGLAFAAACLAATVRLRHDREPI